jgi:4-phytase/acid phosphatase
MRFFMLASKHRDGQGEVSMRRWTLCAVLIVATLAHEAAAAELSLERVVLISRHGVRSPTDTNPPLADIASRPWPSWPVPAGYLTPRGEKLATLMGEYYRKVFAARGLLAAEGCPGANDIYLWADVDQRTRLTGAALLAGMFAGCGLTVQNGPTDKADPIFHPVRAGLCTIDNNRGRAAVLERIGGSFGSVLRTQREPLRKLQAVLGCCAPRLCSPGQRCTLLTMPSGIDVRHKEGGVSLSGPIAIGSTASEVFLLEYAEGLPHNQVAWGRASRPAALRPLLRLHRLDFDLIERTPYLAGRQGSALLQQVLEALRQPIERASSGQSVVPGEAKMVIYVGHDTNLANIGGLLGVHWNLRTYLRDATPPAGAMAFELLREPASGRYFVRMAYYSQTLYQMRRVTRLSLANPPVRARIVVPGCVDLRHGNACPWPDFDARVKQALDPDCVVTKSR